MDTKQSEALILAALNDAETWPGELSIVTFAARSAAELRRLHAENESLRTGYDAARLEITSLQAQAQQCGAGAGCCAQAARIKELEAQLEAVGAGGVGPLLGAAVQQVTAPDGWQLVPAEPTKEMKAAAVKFANGNAVYKNVSAGVLEVEEGIYGEAYEAMLAAAPQPAWAAGWGDGCSPDNCGGCMTSAAPAQAGEPWYGHKFKETQSGIWRCECGKTVKEATADWLDSVLEDAARYRWLRINAIGAFRTNDGNGPVSVYHLSKIPAIPGIPEETDAAIDAAIAAQQGEKHE